MRDSAPPDGLRGNGHANRRIRGFALLIVLWTIAILSLLVAQFTSAGRTEVRVAMNLQANAVAQAAADGALFDAVMRLLRGTWLPDGQVHMARVGNAMVAVQVNDMARKINPNLAPAPVMRALLIHLGMGAGQAAALAQSIADWRTPGPLTPAGTLKLVPYQAARLPYGPANRPFDSVEEIGLVAGMTLDLLARMKPFVSIYQEGDAVDEATDPVAAAADDSPRLHNTGWQLGSTGRVMVVSIEASATGAAGGKFIRVATVRLRAEPSLEQAVYEILTWETRSG